MLVSCLFLGFFLVMTLILGVRNYRYHYIKRHSETWPVTQAIIQKCQAKAIGPFFSLWMQKIPKSLFGYSYNVQGISYIGFFAVARDTYGSLGEAQEIQERLDGKSLAVRYDPVHPQKSFVVDREVLGRDVHQGPEWLPASLNAFNLRWSQLLIETWPKKPVTEKRTSRDLGTQTGNWLGKKDLKFTLGSETGTYFVKYLTEIHKQKNRIGSANAMGNKANIQAAVLALVYR